MAEFAPGSFVTIPKYVKAVQLTPENIEEVAVWCGGEIISLLEGRHKSLSFYARMGELRAGMGDWLIQNEQGSFTAIGNHLFSVTYREYEIDGERPV